MQKIKSPSSKVSRGGFFPKWEIAQRALVPALGVTLGHYFQFMVSQRRSSHYQLVTYRTVPLNKRAAGALSTAYKGEEYG